jgi:hypothetical protein
MFSSAVLDVVVGLIFVFMAVSLAASAILEAIAGIITWRSGALLKGIKDLLNDPHLNGLAGQLYQHALINPRNDGTGTTQEQLRANAPAYIDPGQFAKALIDIINNGRPVPAPETQGMTLPKLQERAPEQQPRVKEHPGRMTDEASIGEAINFVVPFANNPQINALLHDIARNAGFDVNLMQNEIKNWFDNAMDRISGVYKRWTQLWHFLIALGLAIMLNISTIHVAKILWQQPIDTKAVENVGNKDKIPDAETAFQVLDKLPLPIGWYNYRPAGPQATAPTGPYLEDAPEMVLGWLITAVAALFGAPFWFDLLQQIIRLKGAGPSPKEKQEGAAAAG